VRLSAVSRAWPAPVGRVKTALTVAALGTTAYARVLGKKLERAGDVPVEGGTTPNPATPYEVTRAQRQLTALHSHPATARRCGLSRSAVASLNTAAAT
jgi:hypothetical protein